MPNKRSAMKELRKTKKRTTHNNKIKTNIRALTSKCKELVAQGKADEVKKALLAFQQAVDKAAKENVISKNSANRKKSHVMKLAKVSK